MRFLSEESGERLLIGQGTDLTILKPAELTFHCTSGGVLRLELPDRCCRRVEVLRAFPLSRPDEMLSLWDGKEEIGVLERLGDLPEDQQAMLVEELQRRYFRPLVKRIKDVADVAGNYRWDVVTDRGTTSFLAAHPRQSALQLEDGRWIVTDLEGNRYEVPAPADLDPKSRGILNVLLG